MPIIPTVLSLVKLLEKKSLTGLEKREELYKMLKELLGEEEFNRKKDIIDYVLETIIFISKTHVLQGVNMDSIYCC